ncbi:zinc finger domain-containing protein [Leucobacter sp. 1207-22]|uniref:zinc finger domain-containing protein n=1 Tax=Leucobacter sp. 1207-22 TaxID=2604456 RepID=UPI004063AF81
MNGAPGKRCSLCQAEHSFGRHRTRALLSVRKSCRRRICALDERVRARGDACPRCGSKVSRVPFGGRSSCFCSKCQRQRSGNELSTGVRRNESCQHVADGCCRNKQN